MKILRSFYSGSALLTILLTTVASTSAQQLSLQIVPKHSTARIFLGTAESPTSFDVGAAKVLGEIQLHSDDITASGFNLTIYSADRKYKQVYGDQSVITFQSQSVEQGQDGRLEVHGQMTVTQVFGEGPADGENSGASLAHSKQLRTTQQVTFIFDGLEQFASSSELSRGGVVPVQNNESEPGALVNASMSVNGETFPQLLLTIQDVAWPLLPDDKSCAGSAPGEDSLAAACPAATSPASLAQPGDEQEPPAGNLVTIRLALTLATGDSDSAGTRAHTEAVR